MNISGNKSIEIVARLQNIHYLCNVFFIVLDLRLTKVDRSGDPFFILCR